MTVVGPVQHDAAAFNGEFPRQTKSGKVDRESAVRMRLKAGIMRYQMEKGTQAIPPFHVLWEGKYLGTKGTQQEFMAAYTSAVMAFMRL